jgi:hypothetical protein
VNVSLCWSPDVSNMSAAALYDYKLMN